MSRQQVLIDTKSIMVSNEIFCKGTLNNFLRLVTRIGQDCITSKYFCKPLHIICLRRLTLNFLSCTCTCVCDMHQY